MRKFGSWAVTACLLAIVAGPALASGFSIYEQSAKASGQAGAWVARADDAAAAWYNPAAMVNLDGMQVQFGINFITIGSDTEFVSGDPFWGLDPEDPTTFKTESSTATPIHLYFTQSINEKMAWGLAVTTPFGLVTEWADLPVTLSSRKAELVSFVVNPNIAYKFNEQWSGAIGLDYIMADVSHFSRDIDQSALLEAPALSVVGMMDLSGDGDDWGWNLALHYDGPKFDFGFTYRAELSPEIDGDVVFTDIHPALGPDGADLFPNGPGTATLDLPAQAAIGFAVPAGEKWTVEFDVSWAGWSSFEELALDFENETSIPFGVPDRAVIEIPVVEDITLREDWDDTFCFRLGTAWKMNERHELRFGALYDQAPVPVDTLRPSIPDSDRTAVTLGYGFSGGKWNFDAYYMPLWFDDITANGLAEEGVINGTYSSFVHLFGMTFNLKF
jgi:long-chain fatty acid transport protein